MLTSIGLQDTDLRKDKTQEALKLVKLLGKLSKTTQDTDLRKGNTQVALVRKMLDNLTKSLCSSFLTNADGELVKSIEDTEKTLQDNMTSLGLPTNCDTDLRNRFMDDEDQEAQGKNYLEVPYCLLYLHYCYVLNCSPWTCGIVSIQISTRGKSGHKGGLN